MASVLFSELSTVRGYDRLRIRRRAAAGGSEHGPTDYRLPTFESSTPWRDLVLNRNFT